VVETITIRPLAPVDIPSIARWVAATPLWQRYNVTEKNFAERLTVGLANNATIYAAERAGEAVGFVWLVERGAFNRGAYVQLIGVREEARGGGIGRALMEYVETHATARDIFLLVSDFNTDAQQFYTRLGYRPVGKMDDFVVQGISELIYWKRCR
jgi:ribosomal protein S18 acetylase RimI-like enzyme